jgi:hypothetical protein
VSFSSAISVFSAFSVILGVGPDWGDRLENLFFDDLGGHFVGLIQLLLREDSFVPAGCSF